MPKFKITFCDVIEADDKLNAYNEFRAYLKECVEMEDITAFGFQQESAELRETEMKFSAKHSVKQLVAYASGNTNQYEDMVRTSGDFNPVLCVINHDDLLNIEEEIRSAYEAGYQEADKNSTEKELVLPYLRDMAERGDETAKNLLRLLEEAVNAEV